MVGEIAFTPDIDRFWRGVLLNRCRQKYSQGGGAEGECGRRGWALLAVAGEGDGRI